MSAQRHAIEGSVVTCNAKLEIRLRQDGRDWLAWCPPIDVMTQASTKNKALEAIKEAVEGWFESCIERGVLEEALREAGFMNPAEWSEVPRGARAVGLKTATGKPIAGATAPERQPGAAMVDTARAAFARPRQGESSYIEVSIPAYIAAQFNLGDAGRAPR
jgi:predicted RNase H-like HicB family nuclease